MMAVGSLELLLILLTVGGAPGGLLPVSLPPKSVDNQMLALAPQECFAGVALMGRAEIGSNPKSEFERLLKEPAVSRFQQVLFQELENWLVQAASRGGADEANQQMLKQIIAHIKRALDSPLVLYADFDLTGQFGTPNPKGGIALKLGKNEAREAMQLINMLLQSTGAPLEKATLANDVTGIRLMVATGMPIEVAVADDMLIATLGVGEAKKMLSRRGGKPSPMFTRIQKELTVERPNTIAFLNIRRALDMTKTVAPPQVAMIYEAIGIDNFVGLEAISGLHGKHFVTKQRAYFDGKIHGFLDYFGRKPLTEADFATVPADATLVQVLRVEPMEIFAAFKKMVATVEPRAETEIDQELDQLKEETGIDIERHFLPALAGDLQVVLLRADPQNPLAGRITAGVRDAAAARAFAKALGDLIERELPDSPNAPSLKRSQHQGADVYELVINEPGVPPFLRSFAWAVSDQHFVIAPGKANVIAFLDSPTASSNAATIPAIQAELRKKPFALLYMDAKSGVETALPSVQGVLQMLAASGQGPRIDPSLVPPADQVVPHMLPTVMSLSRRDDGFYSESSQTMPGLNMTPMAGVGVALILPAIQAARHRAREVNSTNNMRQIMLALHNYHETYGAFPPAYSVDKDGKPLLSWRVLILPFLEQQDLYDRFHLDEPWDSEHNKKLLDEMPAVFRSPVSTAKPNETTYLGIQMKDAVLAKPEDEAAKREAAKKRGTRLRDIIDGTSNTVVIVEVDSKSAVPWTKPADLTVDPKDPKAALTTPYPGKIVAAFADGSVRRLKPSISKETWLRLFQKGDRQPIDRDELYR